MVVSTFISSIGTIMLNELIPIVLRIAFVLQKEHRNGYRGSVYFLYKGHCVMPPNYKTCLVIKLESHFFFFLNFIGYRLYTPETRKKTRFERIWSQSFNREK